MAPIHDLSHPIWWLEQLTLQKVLTGFDGQLTPNGLRVTLNLSQSPNTLLSLDSLRGSLMARCQGYRLTGEQLILDLSENSVDAMPS